MNRKPVADLKRNHIYVSLDDSDMSFLRQILKITKQKPAAIFMRAIRKVYSRSALKEDVTTNYAAFLTREIGAKKEMIATLNKQIEELQMEYDRITQECDTDEEDSDVQSQ